MISGGDCGSGSICSSTAFGTLRLQPLNSASAKLNADIASNKYGDFTFMLLSNHSYTDMWIEAGRFLNVIDFSPFALQLLTTNCPSNGYFDTRG